MALYTPISVLLTILLLYKIWSINAEYVGSHFDGTDMKKLNHNHERLDLISCIQLLDSIDDEMSALAALRQVVDVDNCITDLFKQPIEVEHNSQLSTKIEQLRKRELVAALIDQQPIRIENKQCYECAARISRVSATQLADIEQNGCDRQHLIKLATEKDCFQLVEGQCVAQNLFFKLWFNTIIHELTFCFSYNREQIDKRVHRLSHEEHKSNRVKNSMKCLKNMICLNDPGLEIQKSSPWPNNIKFLLGLMLEPDSKDDMITNDVASSANLARIRAIRIRKDEAQLDRFADALNKIHSQTNDGKSISVKERVRQLCEPLQDIIMDLTSFFDIFNHWTFQSSIDFDQLEDMIYISSTARFMGTYQAALLCATLTTDSEMVLKQKPSLMGSNGASEIYVSFVLKPIADRRTRNWV